MLESFSWMNEQICRKTNTQTWFKLSARCTSKNLIKSDQHQTFLHKEMEIKRKGNCFFSQSCHSWMPLKKQSKPLMEIWSPADHGVTSGAPATSEPPRRRQRKLLRRIEVYVCKPKSWRRTSPCCGKFKLLDGFQHCFLGQERCVIGQLRVARSVLWMPMASEKCMCLFYQRVFL